MKNSIKKRKFIIKIFCFFLGALVLFSVVNLVILPKYFYDDMWPTTQTFADFYKMEKDSIDVLFLGSSQGASSFSPLELYKSYGIRSYNLSNDLQNMLLSYYWLKEALRFQTPQVVVLETFMLYSYSPEEPLNSPEAYQRKAIDNMKWSSVKREAINSICEIDKNQSKLSYYLTNIRFHTRWTDLEENDFTFCSSYNHKGLMGYSALSGQSGDTGYQPFNPETSVASDEPEEIMLVYLEKIVQLCKESDIQLILVKTPCSSTTVNRYNYLNQFAEDNNIQYLDLNIETIYSEMDYDFSHDNCDYGHLNFWGATKVSDYLGKILMEEYNVPAAQSDAHDQLLDYYEDIEADCYLTRITDFDEYLNAINNDRYTIFISARQEDTAVMNDDIKRGLSELGTTTNFDDSDDSNEHKFICSYYAVLNGDKQNEEISSVGPLFSNGTIRNGAVTYEISSAGCNVGDFSSIVVDGEEYSKNGEGINMVVYCLDTKKVIDSVCFDIYDSFQGWR